VKKEPEYYQLVSNIQRMIKYATSLSTALQASMWVKLVYMIKSEFKKNEKKKRWKSLKFLHEFLVRAMPLKFVTDDSCHGRRGDWLWAEPIRAHFLTLTGCNYSH